MAMAQHAAAISRIHDNGFGLGSKAERRAGIIVADNRLQMAVAQATPRLERSKPRGQLQGSSIDCSIFKGLWIHENSATR
jgi:hypothetical protein